MFVSGTTASVAAPGVLRTRYTPLYVYEALLHTFSTTAVCAGIVCTIVQIYPLPCHSVLRNLQNVLDSEQLGINESTLLSSAKRNGLVGGLLPGVHAGSPHPSI